MRKATYFLALGVVGLSAAVKLSNPLALAFAIRTPYWFAMANYTGQPVNPTLQTWIPSFISVPAFLLLAALLIRRTYLLVASGSLLPPSSFSRSLAIVTAVGLASILLIVVMPLAGPLFIGALGFVAQLAYLLANFLAAAAPIGLLVTELRSLRPVVAGKAK